MVKCAVLVVAAGRGHRFGGEMPKQYRTVGSRMILRHSLATFCAHPCVHAVRTVIHPDDLPLYQCAAENLPVRREEYHPGTQSARNRYFSQVNRAAASRTSRESGGDC